MPYKRRLGALYSIAFVIISSLATLPGMAQTRFEIPDTIPNYAAYQYADECLTAVRRLDNHAKIKDTIWRDTMAVDVHVSQRPFAPAAIEHGRSCLAKVNVDTMRADAQEFNLLAQVLLMVERDADVHRLILRALDSAKNADAWTQIYNSAMVLYSSARPIRVKGLQQLLELVSPYETSREAELRRLYMRVSVAISALTLGDTALPRVVVNDLLKKMQTNEIGKNDPAYRRFLDGNTYWLVAEVLLDQAMDSLKVSTTAYRQFLDHLHAQFSDMSLAETREKPIGKQAPLIGGKYWYRNGWNTDATGQVQWSGEVSQIDPQVVPVPGKINAIVMLSGGCHAQMPGGYGKFTRIIPGGKCWENVALIKRLKRQFPKLEVTIVTRTFGSFGGGLPMSVEEEAKQLSHYILGFFQAPAIQAISETEFIRMPGLDRRRLDIPVKFDTDYQGSFLGDIILVDERGQIFHNVTLLPSLGRMEVTLRKKLEAVFSRVQQ